MDKSEFKKCLKLREQELLILKDKIKNESGNISQLGTNDSVGIASSLTEREYSAAEMIILCNELSMVRHAIYKIENAPDKFGKCEKCLRDIETERLKAKPWARYCRTCKENHEKYAKHE